MTTPSTTTETGPCRQCGATTDTRNMRETDWLCESHGECARCQGLSEIECDACHGAGDYLARDATWDDPEEYRECSQCEGAGLVACPDCQSHSSYGRAASSHDHWAADTHAERADRNRW